MEKESEILTDPGETEVQTRKRERYRSLPPILVSDVEDSRCYLQLLERHFAEVAPQNVIHDGDLISLMQLRWAVGRLHNLAEAELNQRLRLPLLHKDAESPARLRAAYLSGLGEKTFVLLGKQHLDHLKTLNTLATRVERWSAPKTTRAAKSKGGL